MEKEIPSEFWSKVLDKTFYLGISATALIAIKLLLDAQGDKKKKDDKTTLKRKKTKKGKKKQKKKTKSTKTKRKKVPRDDLSIEAEIKPPQIEIDHEKVDELPENQKQEITQTIINNIKEKKNYKFGSSSKISDVIKTEKILKQRKGSWNNKENLLSGSGAKKSSTPTSKGRKLEKGVSMLNVPGSQIIKICFTGGPCAGKIYSPNQNTS